jgi:hypothetical protein
MRYQTSLMSNASGISSKYRRTISSSSEGASSPISASQFFLTYSASATTAWGWLSCNAHDGSATGPGIEPFSDGKNKRHRRCSYSNVLDSKKRRAIEQQFQSENADCTLTDRGFVRPSGLVDPADALAALPEVRSGKRRARTAPSASRSTNARPTAATTPLCRRLRGQNDVISFSFISVDR